jgi:hypothetical protein
VNVDRTVRAQLVAAARASFDRHRPQVRHTDIVGIVDFNKMSREPRFYLLDTNSGRVSEHHVSHGRGSDPAHTGFLHQFSNRHGSNATSEGGYLTTEYYSGKYGRSMRVRGLDWTNRNAEAASPCPITACRRRWAGWARGTSSTPRASETIRQSE